jgi:hypothetical protein
MALPMRQATTCRVHHGSAPLVNVDNICKLASEQSRLCSCCLTAPLSSDKWHSISHPAGYKDEDLKRISPLLSSVTERHLWQARLSRSQFPARSNSTMTRRQHGPAPPSGLRYTGNYGNADGDYCWDDRNLAFNERARLRLVSTLAIKCYGAKAIFLHAIGANIPTDITWFARMNSADSLTIEVLFSITLRSTNRVVAPGSTQ